MIETKILTRYVHFCSFFLFPSSKNENKISLELNRKKIQLTLTFQQQDLIENTDDGNRKKSEYKAKFPLYYFTFGLLVLNTIQNANIQPKDEKKEKNSKYTHKTSIIGIFFLIKFD